VKYAHESDRPRGKRKRGKRGARATPAAPAKPEPASPPPAPKPEPQAEAAPAGADQTSARALEVLRRNRRQPLQDAEPIPVGSLYGPRKPTEQE
jgi:hypothetical protein